MKQHSEEVQEHIASTVDALLSDNLHGRLTALRKDFKEKHPDKSIPDVWRDPETICGFMSKEKVQELLASTPNDDVLFYAAGLTVLSNGKAFFFSDDCCYGSDTCRGFRGVQFPSIAKMVASGGRYDSLDGFINTHFAEQRQLNSVEELATYIVTGE